MLEAPSVEASGERAVGEDDWDIFLQVLGDSGVWAAQPRDLAGDEPRLHRAGAFRATRRAQCAEAAAERRRGRGGHRRRRRAVAAPTPPTTVQRPRPVTHGEHHWSIALSKKATLILFTFLVARFGSC